MLAAASTAMSSAAAPSTTIPSRSAASGQSSLKVFSIREEGRPRTAISSRSQEGAPRTGLTGSVLGSNGAGPRRPNFSVRLSRREVIVGAEGWHYFAPYRGTVARSLEELRQQEFRARRFHHSELPSATIDEATENAGESGTRSILDIQRMSDSPADWAACPVPAEVLCQEFGSERPSR